MVPVDSIHAPLQTRLSPLESPVRKSSKTDRRGVLSVIGDDGYPYGVPINYVYDEKENALYFHGAKEGHKIDAIKKSGKVCFYCF